MKTKRSREAARSPESCFNFSQRQLAHYNRVALARDSPQFSGHFVNWQREERTFLIGRSRRPPTADNGLERRPWLASRLSPLASRETRLRSALTWPISGLLLARPARQLGRAPQTNTHSMGHKLVIDFCARNSHKIWAARN